MSPVQGWYADPTRPGQLRWWDGNQWTPHAQPDPTQPDPGRPDPSFSALPGVASSSGPRTADGVPLTDWWSRARAYLVDAMLLWSISLVLFDHWHAPLLNELVGLWRVWLLIGTGPGGVVDWFSPDLLAIWFGAMAPGVLLRVVYDLACHVSRGATIGQRAVGMRVVPAEQGRHGLDDDRPGLPWQRALVRSLLMRLAAPTVVGWLVLVLWAAVDPRRRSLADLAARTQVVDHRPNGSLRQW